MKINSLLLSIVSKFNFSFDDAIISYSSMGLANFSQIQPAACFCIANKLRTDYIVKGLRKQTTQNTKSI